MTPWCLLLDALRCLLLSLDLTAVFAAIMPL
jgi:hypothetical protein